MSASSDTLSEALERASNPANPPPSKASVLDMTSPVSSGDSDPVRYWHGGIQPTPPNTAVEAINPLWHPPSPQQNDTPISQFQTTWPEGSFPETEADFYQDARTSIGTLQMFPIPPKPQMYQITPMPQMPQMLHMDNRNEYPSPSEANHDLPGEPPQTKASAVDDLFSDVDDNELPDSDAIEQDDHMFEMSDLGKQPQNLDQQESMVSLHTIQGISQDPVLSSLTNMHSFMDRASQPSPTESQLVAVGFEFHNELPEDVQIRRFNDKAFRKALREVQSDLPRKQQWYAWNKAKQMLNTDPESAATTLCMEKKWGDTAKGFRDMKKTYQDMEKTDHDIEKNLNYRDIEQPWREPLEHPRQSLREYDYEHQQEHEHHYEHERHHEHKHKHHYEYVHPYKHPYQHLYEHPYNHQYQHQHQHQEEHQDDYHPEYQSPSDSDSLSTNHTAASHNERNDSDTSDQPVHHSDITHNHSAHNGNENLARDRDRAFQVSQTNHATFSTATGSLTFNQGGDQHVAKNEAENHGDWSSKPEKIDQDRLKKHPLGQFISKVAKEHRTKGHSAERGTTGPAQDVAASSSRQSSNASESSAAAIVTAKKLAEIRSLREKLKDANEEALARMKETLKVKLNAQRDGSSVHGTISASNSYQADAHGGGTYREVKRIDVSNSDSNSSARSNFISSTSTSTEAPPTPLPPRPIPSDKTPSDHDMHTGFLSLPHNTQNGLLARNLKADLLRPHTNTILRRSPSPSSSQSKSQIRHPPPPPISPNRRSPSPWIEHPGINRPDTPRPDQPSSPLRTTTTSSGADIRQSIERSLSLSPFSSSRERERDHLKRHERGGLSGGIQSTSSAAYSSSQSLRSRTPSPASHLGISSYKQYSPKSSQGKDTRMVDTVMTDADEAPHHQPMSQQHQQQHFPHPNNHHHLATSPDPLFSSPLHAGNTYTAPTTPHIYTHHIHPHLTTHIQPQFPPPPIPPSPPSTTNLHLPKTRHNRKSIGGQTTTTNSSTNTKSNRNPTSTTSAVQGANIQKQRQKSRSVTSTTTTPNRRRVTQIAQKVPRKEKIITTTANTNKNNSKVAQAVAKIEDEINSNRGAVGGGTGEGNSPSPRRSGRLATLRKKK